MIVSVEWSREGAWEVAGMLRDQQGEYRKSKIYYGYSKAEAIDLFTEEYQENWNILDRWDIHTDCTHDWSYLVEEAGTMQCSHCGCYQN